MPERRLLDHGGEVAALVLGPPGGRGVPRSKLRVTSTSGTMITAVISPSGGDSQASTADPDHRGDRVDDQEDPGEGHEPADGRQVGAWHRDSSCPDGHRSWKATGSRCRCANRSARMAASTRLLGPAATHRRSRIRPASTSPSTRTPATNQGSASQVAPAHRPVHDRPDDQRDGQPGQRRGKRGHPAAEQGGPVRDEVGDQDAQRGRGSPGAAAVQGCSWCYPTVGNRAGGTHPSSPSRTCPGLPDLPVTAARSAPRAALLRPPEDHLDGQPVRDPRRDPGRPGGAAAGLRPAEAVEVQGGGHLLHRRVAPPRGVLLQGPPGPRRARRARRVRRVRAARSAGSRRSSGPACCAPPGGSPRPGWPPAARSAGR